MYAYTQEVMYRNTFIILILQLAIQKTHLSSTTRLIFDKLIASVTWTKRCPSVIYDRNIIYNIPHGGVYNIA